MTSPKRLRVYPTVRQRARELRQPLTAVEERLWQVLRDRQLKGYKFRRQHPIGRAIADFYCAKVKLVIELDGGVHARQVEYDTERTNWLESMGYTVIRFQNQQVMEQLQTVTGKIAAVCQELERTGQGHGKDRN